MNFLTATDFQIIFDVDEMLTFSNLTHSVTFPVVVNRLVITDSFSDQRIISCSPSKLLRFWVQWAAENGQLMTMCRIGMRDSTRTQ